ncbi:MAG: KOW domain-containing RNA-binding protein [Oscillospiraceae bacterium]|nr:KOW domain-containing RNA-binding protein [Oscillospiraceae bacterium]
MDIVKGCVAQSRAGRDKGRFLLVLGVADGYALVADGDLRKLAKPKRKNLIHLSATGTILGPQDTATDKTLRNALTKRFGGGDRQKEA